MEESIEETGWKLVHGDIFRPPNHTRIFAAVIGSGIQLFCMMAITIFFAMLGMLSPASRGALLTASIFVYEFMGLVAGYFAGRLYKTLKGKVRKYKYERWSVNCFKLPHSQLDFKLICNSLKMIRSGKELRSSRQHYIPV